MGGLDHHEEFYNIVIEFPRTAQIPVLISTLGKKAFQVAGEIDDGALSWMCSIPYLLIPEFHYYIKQLLLIDAQNILQ
jgi:hypothetical protein